MNWVTINGTKSTQIKGLLIQSLPPITKPKMRTTIEEIDGRDGDIITQLGFSAYDKTIKIGLFGDFDINRVMSFFYQSGNITFSNEPDKYYKFNQLDSIDFERLVRFRTADVKIHVQPFKYPVANGSITQAGGAGLLSVTNRGNIYSRPKIEIRGTGTLEISVNGENVFEVSMPTGNDLIIDGEEMEAYNDDGLMNRHVKGDYSKFVLPAQTESLIGCDITDTSTSSEESITISNYERWI